MKSVSFIIGMLIYSSVLAAQKMPEDGWHLKDYSADGFYGISLERAYAFLRDKGIKPHSIIVGLLETGIDTAHEDLASVLWQNKSEIGGNGLDDDNNGYVDDIHGWNFLGGASGNVTVTTSEWTRVYWRYKTVFDGKAIDTNSLSKLQKYEYALWLKARSGVVGTGPSKGRLDTIRNYVSNVVFCDSVLKILLNKPVYDNATLASWKATSQREGAVKEFMLETFEQFDAKDLKNTTIIREMGNYLEGEILKAKNEKEAPLDKRRILTGNDDTDPGTLLYGNNNIWAGNIFHGTHVAGIIGAARNNGKGVDGIADAVYLMSVRATADGDEYDKDIAAAIRYATNNGAKVINMSFGKSLSPDKPIIDDAVRYALHKDVLIVQAAGNSGRNINGFDNFPNPRFLFSDSVASNWITVGASDCNGYKASFSNYGNKIVDLFAPGVGIYSTTSGEVPYTSLDGTSMASPVVAGVAALLREYFPTLTAAETKNFIVQSVTTPPSPQQNKQSDQKQVGIKDLCITGGIVNAYTAVRLAYEYSKRK
jgi:subtilisin family serine protease